MRATKEDIDQVITELLSTWGDQSQYPMNSRLRLHQSWSGHWEGDKFLVPCQKLREKTSEWRFSLFTLLSKILLGWWDGQTMSQTHRKNQKSTYTQPLLPYTISWFALYHFQFNTIWVLDLIMQNNYFLWEYYLWYRLFWFMPIFSEMQLGCKARAGCRV